MPAKRTSQDTNPDNGFGRMAGPAASNRKEPGEGLFSGLLILLVTAAIVRSAIATRLDGFTIEEAYHIAAGVSYRFRACPE